MIAVIDGRAPRHIIKGLVAHGFEPLPLPPHPNLPKPVASHPDMLLFFAPNGCFCTEIYAEIAKKELEILSKHTGMPIIKVRQSVAPLYPHDILLNAARIGNRLFCLEDHTAEELTHDEGYKICHVRQGYAKCSTLPVGDHALITADPSIGAAAQAEGLDVLLTKPAKIELQGYDTGFLGGASSFAPYRDLSEIYFCGDIQTHPEADRIVEFCQRHHEKPVSLADGSLYDLGTVFLI